MPQSEGPPSGSTTQYGRRRILVNVALVTAMVGVQIPIPAGVRAMTAARQPHPPTPAQPNSTSTPLELAEGRTVHFLGLGNGMTGRLLTRIAAEIDGAVAAVTDFWGDDWPRDVVIAAAGSNAQFGAWTRWPSGAVWVDVAAAAVADTVDPRHRIATGQRVVFAPGAARMSDDALRIV